MALPNLPEFFATVVTRELLVLEQIGRFGKPFA
jgi:hypothetical protein